MKEEIPQEVLSAFVYAGTTFSSTREIKVEPVSGGLINRSYKVCYGENPALFLQRINKNVFVHPEQVQENYILLSQYAEFEFTGLRLPALRYCGRMNTLFVDERSNYWRAFEFIEDARMLPIAQKPSQAKATAKAFAKFTAAFDEFNADLLKPVIPDFHDVSWRYQQFEASLNTELYERMPRSLPLIDELKRRERYKHFYEIITGSDEFPRRVMHHDAKIANILFSTKTGKVICPVDFDTAMPGYFFSDPGDMIRSIVCEEDENSTNLDAISIRKEFYEAIVSGYCDIMGEQLTNAEKKYIHYAGILMIYMQALRFLTDYLNGDIYYRTVYREHNFDRAKNQLILLQRLEDFLKRHYNFNG